MYLLSAADAGVSAAHSAFLGLARLDSSFLRTDGLDTAVVECLKRGWFLESVFLGPLPFFSAVFFRRVLLMFSILLPLVTIRPARPPTSCHLSGRSPTQKKDKHTSRKQWCDLFK